MSALAHASELEGLRVADAMSDGVLSLPRTAPLSEVARLMAEQQIHCVVVSDDLDDCSEAWGVVSDLDLVAAATVRGLDDQTAGASAATTVMCVDPEDSLFRAGQLMTEHAIAHLVVVDPESRSPAGILSTLDVASALAHHVAEGEPCSA